MKTDWLIKYKKTLLFGACCLLVYLVAPLVIHPFLCLFGIFPLFCLIVGGAFSLWGGFRWEQPVLAAALFVPTMFLYYNESAWVYPFIFGAFSLVGCLAGAFYRRGREQP